MIKKIVIAAVFLMMTAVPYVLGDALPPPATPVPAKPTVKLAEETNADSTAQIEVIGREKSRSTNYTELMIVIITAAAVFVPVIITQINKRKKDGEK